MIKRIYWYFSFLGMMSFSASFLMGFQADSAAPPINFLWNALLYMAFIVVHIVMTMPAFKRAVFGRPEGSPAERRIYVTISVVSWVAVYALHWPTPGFSLESPPWLEFVGYCAALLALIGFFEFATFTGLEGLLGVSGEQLSHSVGVETPLMTDGPYAVVRHPMYRAAFYLAFSTLLIHPNSCQLLFALFTSASFLGFIPFEEYQLVKARGDAYRQYMQTTPYRVFPGLW